MYFKPSGQQTVTYKKSSGVSLKYVAQTMTNMESRSVKWKPETVIIIQNDTLVKRLQERDEDDKTRSVPVQLGHMRASSSQRMSFSTLIDREWILNIWVRP